MMKKLYITEAPDDTSVSNTIKNVLDRATPGDNITSNTSQVSGDPTVEMCVTELEEIKALIIPFTQRIKTLQPQRNERDGMLIRLCYAYCAFSFSILNTMFSCIKSKKQNTPYTMFQLIKSAYSTYKQLK